jgi:hypothetical protein
MDRQRVRARVVTRVLIPPLHTLLLLAIVHLDRLSGWALGGGVLIIILTQVQLLTATTTQNS